MDERLSEDEVLDIAEDEDAEGEDLFGEDLMECVWRFLFALGIGLD